MNDILNEFSTEFEGQRYVDPNVSLNEQNSFVQNLRDTQNLRNAEIASQTESLGSYPSSQSNLGGLVGGSGYWTSRFQTPQTNSLVANLKATAMAQALNEAMGNEVAMWKQRYNRAYNDYRRRNRNSNDGGGGGTLPVTGGVDEDDTSRTIGSVRPAFSPAGSGTYQFVPNSSSISSGSGLSGSALPSQLQNIGNTLWPAGSVDVKRNASGVITDLTYNGKTYSGDSARKMWGNLGNFGNVKSGR